MFRYILTVLSSLFFITASATTRIAIANLGPHQSLIDIVQGIQDHAKTLNLDIDFDVEHVNFDMTQISRMLAAQKARKPDIIIAVTTSVAQQAKVTFRGSNLPIIFAAITDPTEAKLLEHPNKPHDNVTGVSDQQDIRAVLKFMRHHQPGLKRLGIPFAQNESNDRSLLSAFQEHGNSENIEIIPISIDNLHDMPHRIRAVAPTLDAIYVGPSNMIQPALPSVIQQANRADIPVYNFNEASVHNHHAFASYSVDYTRLGHSIARIIQRLTQGEKICNISPVYPKASEHTGTVSNVVAKRLNVKTPKKPYPSTTYIGE